MKLRSVQELSDALDGNLAMRRQELTSLKLLALSEKHPTKQQHFVRAGLCILYAHWEGFTKFACDAYVAFVAGQGLNLRDLSGSLLALCLRDRFPATLESSRLSHRIDLMRTAVSTAAVPADLPFDDAVSMESNLTSAVLRGVVALLEGNYANYATKEKLIDAKLVHSRNAVAHGSLDRVDVGDYELLHEAVSVLIDWIRTDTLNAAVTVKYRR